MVKGEGTESKDRINVGDVKHTLKLLVSVFHTSPFQCICLSTKSRGRLLRLEVIWSTVSREEAREFLLPRGSIIERSQGRLLQFETFRALWAQDERRRSVQEEWALLSGVL